MENMADLRERHVSCRWQSWGDWAAQALERRPKEESCNYFFFFTNNPLKIKATTTTKH